MRIFHSKHQKLILQCYPPGKGVDKQPNASELSYLLYYASTRRIKLEKVAMFLDKKTTSDFHRNKAGNMHVTLSIVSALIDKCAEDLNVIATYVCSILQKVLTTKDLSLCKSALGTYGVFCGRLDASIFPGNKLFVDLFSLLSESFVRIHDDMAYEQPNPHFLEWRMISLVACRHLARCVGHDTKFGRKFVAKIVPIYLGTVHESSSVDVLVSRMNAAHLRRGSQNDAGLARVTSSRSAQAIFARIDEDLESNSVTSEDITNEAFRGLQVLFGTTLTSQVSEITQMVVKHLQHAQFDSEWAARFTELLTSWIPVQLRFLTVSALLAQLAAVVAESSPDQPRYSEQARYAQSLRALVASDINMIGLSTSDIVSQVLDLQADLFLTQSAYLAPTEVATLKSVYSEIVCHVATHIYYAEQVPDSVRVVLGKIEAVVGAQGRDEHVSAHILALLDVVAGIFAALRNKSSSIARNRVELEIWEGSLQLLAPDPLTESRRGSVRDSQSEPSGSRQSTHMRHSSSLSSRSGLSQINEIQRRYMKVFSNFLAEELQHDGTSSSSSSESLSHIKPSKKHNFTLVKKRASNDYEYSEGDRAANLRRPDVSRYISAQDNFFVRLLHHVDLFLSRTDYPNIENVFLLTDILKTLVGIYGLNFYTNFVPFFFHWLLPRADQASSQRARFKDTLACILMFYATRELDAIYDSLDGYCTKSDFLGLVLHNIAHRKSQGSWMSGLDSLPSDDDIANNPIRNRNIYSPDALRKEFAEFVGGSIFLSMWVGLNKPFPKRREYKDAKDTLDKNTNTNANYNTLSRVSINGGLNNLSRIHSNSTLPGLNKHVSNGTLGGYSIPPANGHSNGHSLGILSRFDDSDSSSDESVRHSHNNGLGLGLGNVNDISSIHSELHYNRLHQPGSSIFTERLTPKVAELKEINDRMDVVSVRSGGRSILKGGKDIEEILGELGTDEFVV